MLKFFDVSYEELKTDHGDELYRLRKKTFFDRLGWDVLCSQGMESDEFDLPGTRYILGICTGKLICSVRFINLDKSNMITHTFKSCFNDVELPINGVESSRFFVDKDNTRKLLGDNFPTSQLLFLSMANWANNNNYKCIHTIVSRPMLIILRRSKWNIKVIKEAYLDKDERIYLVSLPTERHDQRDLAQVVVKRTFFDECSLKKWPLMLSV